MRDRLSLAAVMLALGLAACETTTDDCSGTGRDGLTLTVTDSLSGADLNPIATVTVTQLTAPFESRSGTLTGPPSPLSLAAGRPGPYRITVVVDGYSLWEKEVTVAQTDRKSVV